MDLLELRKQHGLTQKEVAQMIGIPYRTYIRYEKNPSYFGSYKYRFIYSSLESKLAIDEEHGLLSFDSIKKTLIPILKSNNVNCCYLFGSYAKGNARENSDIDLLIDTDLTGLKFFRLVEELRTALHKKIDLLRLKDIESNNPIALEILRDGIKLL